MWWGYILSSGGWWWVYFGSDGWVSVGWWWVMVCLLWVVVGVAG